MFKIGVEFTHVIEVEIPVNSFNDICTNNMSINDSDKLLKKAILNKLGFEPMYINNTYLVGKE
jgi:hypothetical protein